MLLNQTIRLFLDGIGRREEYEFYLGKFQSAGTACFALLVPDADVLEQAAEALIFDLHFLVKLGLTPAVALSGENAAAGWSVLKNDPLFFRADDSNLPEITTQPQVPVFVEPENEVVHCLETKIPAVARRVHFIRAAGGLQSDCITLQNPPENLSAEDRRLFDCAAALLARHPGTHLSVTSPINLLQEIFTVKGAGTLFRRGSEILRETQPDLQRLQALLRDSFGRDPLPSALGNITVAYIEKNFRGAALLEKHPEGLYLSKFAVGPEARGEGLAQELWDAVCRDHPTFFWRSRNGNRVNHWYDRHADGRHRAAEWTVFWRGIDVTHLPALIAFCSARPSDFSAE